MYLTMKQQVKHLSKTDYKTLQELCHIAKNLYNQGLYNIRQYYFATKKYLSYEQSYALLKEYDNYKLLNSNMAQQILKEVDGAFRSFFGLIKLAGEGGYHPHDSSLPRYLKKDGFTTLVIGFVRIKGKQGIKETTNQQKDLYRRRNNQVNDYVLKTARTIIDYCLLYDNGMLVIGYHETLQRYPHVLFCPTPDFY